MAKDVGEYVVGAYLQMKMNCSLINYNVRPPGGKRVGQGELDVVGIDLQNMRAYLCEVTTHITGLLYTDYPKTIKSIGEKHNRQKAYANEHLPGFHITYMFWSPVVSVGFITENLVLMSGLELVINEKYAEKVEELRLEARALTHDTGNPFFRTLQILERIKKPK